MVSSTYTRDTIARRAIRLLRHSSHDIGLPSRTSLALEKRDRRSGSRIKNVEGKKLYPAIIGPTIPIVLKSTVNVFERHIPPQDTDS